MASIWGAIWGPIWGDIWAGGAVAPEPTPAPTLAAADQVGFEAALQPRRRVRRVPIDAPAVSTAPQGDEDDALLLAMGVL